MSIIEAIILGVVQGLTEFLPVSSSGHLVLLHDWFGSNKNSLAFDVALHLGTLIALLVFFFGDARKLAHGVINKRPQAKRIVLLVVVATVPGVIAGVLLENAAETTLRSSRLVAFNLIVVAVLMLMAERFARNRQQTKLSKTTLNQALAVGAAQAAAIVPGVSRSGSTITAGLFAGMGRLAATRFSFYLAIPIIGGAVVKVLLDGGLRSATQEPLIFVVGITTAFLSGLVAIRFMLAYLAKHSLAAFAYYRILLGAMVLVLL